MLTVLLLWLSPSYKRNLKGRCAASLMYYGMNTVDVQKAHAYVGQ